MNSIELKPFKCPECPFRAKEKGNIKKHLTSVHLFQSPSSRPFPCSHPGCNYRGKTTSSLKLHSNIHTNEKSFICSYSNCNYSAKQKGNLKVHLRVHTGEKPYVCQFESCCYAATSHSQFILHSRTHTKEKPFKCIEPNCEFSAADKSYLISHRYNKHPKDGKERPSFACPLCEYSSNAKGYLSKHVKSHTLEKLFKCDEPNCNFDTKTKQHMKIHKLVHSDERPFACSVDSCEYRCKYKDYLNLHLKTHSEERQFKCELCPYRGKTRTTVKNHLQNVHSDVRPFKCTEPKCHYASKKKGELRTHLLFHKGEKKYSCSFPDCDYKAVLASMVKSHEKHVHSSIKSFKCSICDYSGKTKANLTTHVRTHTKETPYICKENGCGYRAKQTVHLKGHVQRNHS